MSCRNCELNEDKTGCYGSQNCVYELVQDRPFPNEQLKAQGMLCSDDYECEKGLCEKSGNQKRCLDVVSCLNKPAGFCQANGRNTSSECYGGVCTHPSPKMRPWCKCKSPEPPTPNSRQCMVNADCVWNGSACVGTDGAKSEFCIQIGNSKCACNNPDPKAPQCWLDSDCEYGNGKNYSINPRRGGFNCRDSGKKSWCATPANQCRSDDNCHGWGTNFYSTSDTGASYKCTYNFFGAKCDNDMPSDLADYKNDSPDNYRGNYDGAEPCAARKSCGATCGGPLVCSKDATCKNDTCVCTKDAYLDPRSECTVCKNPAYDPSTGCCPPNAADCENGGYWEAFNKEQGCVQTPGFGTHKYASKQQCESAVARSQPPFTPGFNPQRTCPPGTISNQITGKKDPMFTESGQLCNVMYTTPKTNLGMEVCCMLPEKYDKTWLGVCGKARNGRFDTLAACQDRYSSVGLACIKTGGGEYASKAECEAFVSRYDLLNDECVQVPGGEFGSKQACDNANRYGIDPVKGCVHQTGGAYDTLAACDAAMSYDVDNAQEGCFATAGGPYGTKAACTAAVKAAVQRARCSGENAVAAFFPVGPVPSSRLEHPNEPCHITWSSPEHSGTYGCCVMGEAYAWNGQDCVTSPSGEYKTASECKEAHYPYAVDNVQDGCFPDKNGPYNNKKACADAVALSQSTVCPGKYTRFFSPVGKRQDYMGRDCNITYTTPAHNKTTGCCENVW